MGVAVFLRECLLWICMKATSDAKTPGLDISFYCRLVLCSPLGATNWKTPHQTIIGFPVLSLFNLVLVLRLLGVHRCKAILLCGHRGNGPHSSSPQCRHGNYVSNFWIITILLKKQAHIKQLSLVL